jgi:hypothetical protein
MLLRELHNALTARGAQIHMLNACPSPSTQEFEDMPFNDLSVP